MLSQYHQFPKTSVTQVFPEIGCKNFDFKKLFFIITQSIVYNFKVTHWFHCPIVWGCYFEKFLSGRGLPHHPVYLNKAESFGHVNCGVCTRTSSIVPGHTLTLYDAHSFISSLMLFFYVFSVQKMNILKKYDCCRLENSLFLDKNIL